MTNKEFYREFGNIDPKMIEAAAPSDKVQKNKRISWIKWASIAACLTLCVLCAIPLITNLFSNVPNIPDNLSGLSDSAPDLGFWCGVSSTDTVIKTNETLNTTVSFGSLARDVERFVITIESQDFNIEKSCRDELLAGQDFEQSDYYVTYKSNLTASDLPFTFTMNLTPKSGKDQYKGSIEVKIEEYMIGGWGTAVTTIYYFGDSDNICFSTESLENAEKIFKNLK